MSEAKQFDSNRLIFRDDRKNPQATRVRPHEIQIK